MDLRDYIRMLRRRWRLVVVAMLVGVASATVLTVTQSKVYTSNAQFFVSAQDPAGGSGIGNAYTGGLFTQQRVKSYVSLVSSARAAGLVKSDLDLSLTPETISKMVTATAPLDTVLINVAVTNGDPATAQRVANSLGKIFPTLVNELERPVNGGPSPVKLSLVQTADLPTAPTSPRPKLNLALGLLVGLAVGVGGAVLRETLDTTVKGPEQAHELVGAPVLGAINFDPEAAKDPLVVMTAPNSVRAEAFRQLRTNLQFVDIEHPLRSVVITSSIPGEGKSTTACNLAISLAQAGLKVILIEGDLRRPRIANYLGVEGAVGLTSVLLGRVSLDEALQTWGDLTLQVLPSGPLPPNPSELLGSSGMQDLLREVEARADLVIIDAPPLLPVTDAAVLGALTSGLVMLIRSNSTKREQLARATETVHQVGANLLGSVLNMVSTKGPDAYGYGYGYGYHVTQSTGRLGHDESPVRSNARHADQATKTTPAAPESVPSSTPVLPVVDARPPPSAESATAPPPTAVPKHVPLVNPRSEGISTDFYAQSPARPPREQPPAQP